MRTPRPIDPSVPAISRTRELRGIGLSETRLRARDAVHALHGVVAFVGFPQMRDPFLTRVAATRLILSPGQFLSRRTAARLLGIPLASGREGIPVDVGAIRPVRAPHRKELVGHEIRAGTLRGIPLGPLWLPDPEDVWCLLAPVCSLGELVAAGDYLISGPSRRVRALLLLSDLEGAVARFQGTRGSRLRAQALPLLREGVESPAESRLRLGIVLAGFPEPRVSCPVPTARRLYHSDLGYPGWRIAVEHEGAYHFEGGVEQARIDTARPEEMRAAGWIVLRTTARDLRDPREFHARLAAAIAARSR